MMGLDFEGRVFEDNFLIADVRMTADFPTERWFWFAPPFAEAQSALLHKQPDDIWRIDFQLGWDIDRDAELDPTRIRDRVDAMLSSQVGEVPRYDLVWTSIYTFQCRRMKSFRHGSVFFAGDSAHQVSPFGARGANSGMQDAENIAWKLDAVLKRRAPDALLDTYHSERSFAADENILNSTRATDFMTPKSDISKTFRDAVLDLAGKHSFARPFVNSGRLSQPCVYDDHTLFGEDALAGPASTRPGAACPDAPVGNSFLLDHLGNGFTALNIGDTGLNETIDNIAVLNIETPSVELRARFLGDTAQAIYLIRPDHHIVARWSHFDEIKITAAYSRALGKTLT
jgi:3-(3-hydroxy-phenyl)propionate hydroxylase